MAQWKGEGKPISNSARDAVMRASRTCVGLLKANQDDDQSFCEHAASMFMKGLEKNEMVHLIAVQNVWLLEQMEFIDRMTQGTMSVDEQITDLGMHVALQGSFDDFE